MTAVIMAAGMSRRFGGRNKLLLCKNGKHLVEFVMDAVAECEFSETAVVCSDEKIAALARSRGFLPVFNERPSLGQSESIRLGVENIAASDGIAFFVADNPFVSVSAIHAVQSVFRQSNRIVVSSASGKMQNPAIFPYRYAAALCALSGDVGGKKIIAEHADDVSTVPIDAGDYYDIDDEADWQRFCHSELPSAASSDVCAAPRDVYVTPRDVYVTPRDVYVTPRDVYVTPRLTRGLCTSAGNGINVVGHR